MATNVGAHNPKVLCPSQTFPSPIPPSKALPWAERIRSPNPKPLLSLPLSPRKFQVQLLPRQTPIHVLKLKLVPFVFVGSQQIFQRLSSSKVWSSDINSYKKKE